MTEEDKLSINNFVSYHYSIGFFNTLLNEKLISQKEYEKLIKVFKKKVKQYIEKHPEMSRGIPS